MSRHAWRQIWSTCFFGTVIISDEANSKSANKTTQPSRQNLFVWPRHFHSVLKLYFKTESNSGEREKFLPVPLRRMIVLSDHSGVHFFFADLARVWVSPKRYTSDTSPNFSILEKNVLSVFQNGLGAHQSWSTNFSLWVSAPDPMENVWASTAKLLRLSIWIKSGFCQ